LLRAELMTLLQQGARFRQHEVAPRDPVSLAVVSCLSVLATVTAAWLPARRASRVDPIKALRVE
jgi:hypothetical protein